MRHHQETAPPTPLDGTAIQMQLSPTGGRWRWVIVQVKVADCPRACEQSDHLRLAHTQPKSERCLPYGNPQQAVRRLVIRRDTLCRRIDDQRCQIAGTKIAAMPASESAPTMSDRSLIRKPILCDRFYCGPQGSARRKAPGSVLFARAGR